VRLGGMISTLLGPERTTAGLLEGSGCCFGTVQAWPGYPYRIGEPALVGVVFLVVWWVTDRVVGWLLVENCTVDASILFSVG
jgi:hypothetical protein